MDRQDLNNYLNEYLNVNDFSDLCPNGLQVTGSEQVTRILCAVSASVELFEQAIAENFDTIIVHHGIIWNFERPLYQGGYRERVRLLLTNNINLFAYHLPLDAHETVGNNVLLCRLFGFKNIQPFGNDKGQYIGMRGECEPTGKDHFFNKVEQKLDRVPIVFPYGPEKIKSAGIISGGAQKHVSQAVSLGLDAFITGEVSEHIMHYAKEEKIHFISAGHYATERLGIIALGDLIKEKFKVEVRFTDIPNPV